MKATRIAYSKNLTASKYVALKEQARRLGVIRSEVWDRYGSISGVKLTDRQIRDTWLKEGKLFNVPANAWKETLRDAKADISMSLEAAKVKVRRAIHRYADDDGQRKQLFTLLKSNDFADDPYLSRVVRKYWHRGHNHTHNQIIVRADNVKIFQRGGKVWLKIPGLVPRKQIAIPLDTTVEPSGTLRLILRGGLVEVHYAIDIEKVVDCGERTIGVDKGYSEVFVDSEGEHHGTALGGLLRTESDYLKIKYQRRAKLRAVAKDTRKDRKRQNIAKNNLGRKKLDRRSRCTRASIRDVVFKATHAVVDKASVVVAEDLTSPIKGKSLGRNMNRRLAAWTNGIIAEALENVSQRRSASLALINPSYTSQVDSRNGCLLGKRRGDSFYCFDGVVLQADENAAQNVLARLYDPEIGRWTPYRKVRSILLARTERHRLGLLNLDSSCILPGGISTESELPAEQLCSGK